MSETWEKEKNRLLEQANKCCEDCYIGDYWEHDDMLELIERMKDFIEEAHE